jgi:hypothetical protein
MREFWQFRPVETGLSGSGECRDGDASATSIRITADYQLEIGRVKMPLFTSQLKMGDKS